MEKMKKYGRLNKNLYVLISFLIIVTVGINYLIHNQSSNNEYLKVVFLDVGQGDSIFIEAPNGTQMLIDGGPDAKVLTELSKIMPFGDRSIDLVVATHPDSDHIGGLPLVINSYNVSHIIENGAESDSDIYKNLEGKITKNKIDKIIAKRGMHIVLDEKKNIYFDILYPDRDVSNLDSNDGSIVGKLVYNNESFMMMGDATFYVENVIGWNENRNVIKSEVLKLGHHGSHTSNSLLWLEEVNPGVAVISAGLNNKYGHPHQDILDRLELLNIPYLNTANKGNIIFETDGNKLLYSK